MPEWARLPAPDTVLRVGCIALIGAIVAAGALQGLLDVDLAPALEWVPACAFRNWTGLPCPGCGMTHALLLLGRLELAEAVSAHPAAPALVAAAAFGALRPDALRGRARDAIAGVALVAVGIIWWHRVAGAGWNP